MQTHPFRNMLQQQGFSLIQVAIAVAVAGIVFASFIPGGQIGSDAEKSRVTHERMQKIEDAMHVFMAKNLRRPCPADATKAFSSDDFGKEASTSGECVNTGAIRANFSDQRSPRGTTIQGGRSISGINSMTGLTVGMYIDDPTNFSVGTRVTGVNVGDTSVTIDAGALVGSGGVGGKFVKVVAGGVPTKTLGLSDEYALDGYGRRLMYMVDNRATEAKGCHDMQAHDAKGGISIMDANNAAAPVDEVMWSLLSYGKDGHGAFPIQGGATRLDIHPPNTQGRPDTLINAFVDSGFAANFAPKLVKRSRITGYDDDVWYAEATKNSCCLGNMCNFGTHVTANGIGPDWNQIVTGDINGDGIQDTIIAAPGDVDTGGEAGSIYVLYGKKIGWQQPPTNALLKNLTDNTISDYKDGFMIEMVGNNISGYKDAFHYTLATGDLNGDGYDDLLISGVLDVDNDKDTVQQELMIIWGSSTLSSDNSNVMASDNGIVFDIVDDGSGALLDAGAIATGDFDGDGHQDIFWITYTNQAYILWGRSKAAWDSDFSACTWQNNTNGSPCHIQDNYGMSITGTFGIEAAKLGDTSNVATGDINGDGYDDIIVTSSEDYSGNRGRAFVLFGHTDLTQSSPGIDITGSNNYIYSGDYTGSDPYVAFANTVKIADVNNDGIKDMIFVNASASINVMYGKKVAPADWESKIDIKGCSGCFTIDLNTNSPSPASTHIASVAVGDINGDNLPDIVLGDTDESLGLGAYIFFQPTSGWSDGATYSVFNGDNAINAPNFKAIGRGGDSDSKAGAVAIADINQDGKEDLLIGCPACKTDDGTVGMLYMLYGRKNIPWDTSTDLDLLLIQ